MRTCRAVAVVIGLAVGFTGCGGGGTPGGGGGPSSGTNSATVTVTFTGATPIAIATQIGDGGFTNVTPSNQVTFTVPSGTTKYAFAFLCPTAVSQPFNAETVVEATTLDSTSFTENCFSSFPATGTATGNASSSIPGTSNLEVVGNGGSSNSFPNPATFSLPMNVGTNDVAVLAHDGSLNIVGIKIVRSQTVPGPVGGSGIVLTSPADASTTQSATITNVSPGLNPPSALVRYHTANGTIFELTNTALGPTNPQSYAVVPAASTQPGDFYHYFVSTNTTSGGQLLGMAMSTTNGGGAVTLPLPVPWTFSGPVPAKLPVFTFNYSGFNGQAQIEDSVFIEWFVGSTSDQITVTATANFQSGATTVAIPDLSSIPGFLTPAPSGTTIFWDADIFAGNPQVMTTLQNPPPNASGSFVQNGGQFIQP